MFNTTKFALNFKILYLLLGRLPKATRTILNSKNDGDNCMLPVMRTSQGSGGTFRSNMAFKAEAKIVSENRARVMKAKTVYLLIRLASPLACLYESERACTCVCVWVSVLVWVCVRVHVKLF